MAHSSSSDISLLSSHIPTSTDCTLAYTLRCLSKITDLSYRLSCLSTFLSAITETIQFLHLNDLIFTQCQEEIIMLMESAHKTLESSGVIPYLWASCPKHLLPHKTAYIDLLRMLESKACYVDTRLQKRLRILLMPLTSTFKICPQQVISGGPSVSLISHGQQRRTSTPSESDVDSSDFPSSTDTHTSMPPPDAFPAVTDQSHHLPSVRKSRKYLWHPEELHTYHPERKIRSRSPRRRGATSTADDQENCAPTEKVSFYQPPRRQRFGIFLTGKSTMLGNYNRSKDRIGHPTH